MESININEALEKNEDMQRGLEEFRKIDDKATAVSQEITSKLVESVIKEENKYNITTSILTVAKCLTQLSSFLYDTEDEFLAELKKARESVISDVIPALLRPEPCGKCEECKNGHPEDCINPDVRADYTTSRFLPILANMLIEYDLFNKVLHMYTVGKEENENKEE